MALARLAGLALALALGVIGIAIAQRSEPQAIQPRGDVAISGADLIDELHQINQHEIQAGTLAKRNSQSVRVQRYGDMLVRDHRQAEASLRELAGDRDLDVEDPIPKDAAEVKHAEQRHAALQKLRALQGLEFDRMFLAEMVAGHEAAIEKLERARAETQDASLRGLIARLLPVMEQHRDLAIQLDEELEATARESAPRPAE